MSSRFRLSHLFSSQSRKREEGIKLGRIDGAFNGYEVLTESQLNHHVHVVGASGYGKTVLLSHIIEATIKSGKGLLFIDLKADRETIEQVKRFVRDANRESDLQIFSISDSLNSRSYNPLQNGTATQVRDRVMASLNWSEEYYRNTASSALLKVLRGLVTLRSEANAPRSDLGPGAEGKIARLDSEGQGGSGGQALPDGERRQGTVGDGGGIKGEEVEGPDAGNEITLQDLYDGVTDLKFVKGLAIGLKALAIKKQTEEYFKWLSDRANFDALQGLRVQLESLLLSDFGGLLGCGVGGCGTLGAIDLFRAVGEKKIVYMLLDSRRYQESSKSLGRFILQDLKAVSARIDAEIPKDERVPFTIVIDEFADLASDDFVSFLDRARSSKMSVVVAHQELSDLLRVSPEFQARLMGNTSTLYAFLQKRSESAEIISKIAGTKSVRVSTEQHERFLFLDVPTGKKSVRVTEEFIIHPNIVKSLGVGECVVIKKYPRSIACKVSISRPSTTS